jgi:3-deoxy-D-arabino-heptulosonate 7-phosphate (DAHP) synthase
VPRRTVARFGFPAYGPSAYAYFVTNRPHATAQGVIAGANMVLLDFHPAPARALVDGPQPLLPQKLPHFLEDIQIARTAFEKA